MRFQRKYFVNNDFFKEWSHDMAYVLGFWWADGCMVGQIFSISQKETDGYLLKQILGVMDSTYPLYKSNGSCSFQIRSVSIINDIKELGGIENKSKKVVLPCVPDLYLPDFMRGLFDGDGSICLQTGRRSYHASLTSGSKLFLEQVNKSLIESIPDFRGSNVASVVCKKGRKMPHNRNLLKDSTYHMLRFGVNDTKRLGAFLYKNDGLCLFRKRDIYLGLTPIREATYNKDFLSFKEAKKKVMKLNLRTWDDWRKYCASGKKPLNIPSLPNRTYKDEFNGMRDFLSVS